MSGPEIVSLGCRLNMAEGEAMRALAGDADDLIVVNSCAVTAEAVRQSAQAARRAARQGGKRVIVTGCAAQLEPDRFAAIPGVAAVLGNREKWDAALLRSPTPPPVAVSDIMAARETAPHLAAGFGTRARAFVEVQNGCDHRCTFCVIPFARGPSRSVPPALVVDKVKALVDRGYHEVVLTGVDTTSYGADIGDSLGSLVERVLAAVPALRRLRLSSLDSVEIDDRLFALVTQEPRVQPHLHLSLQAGDDMVLKRMKRRHTRGQAVALVERLKAARPEIAIGADLIAGFPTETEEQAGNTLRLLADCDIVFAHVFPYSARRGTPAARMPQVEPQVARARAKRLREAGETRRRAWLGAQLGAVQSLLVEREDGRGHVGSYAEARLAGGAPGAGNLPRPGDIVAMRVTAVDGDALIGELA
ncbi:tRNA (N(6)-L-threonylcarbamoyladenosine(37)-C(2))-methylthiotransferase MtaB [Sphingomonas sp.]|uniref:tRNA (N(6)-L-threonylcarbamoyladenosine(37)-C(2))- methylthiotransferase MtaB n=1 Tax=Sphingomonas sp. TaxID=28214 RepID=UPI003B0087C7